MKENLSGVWPYSPFGFQVMVLQEKPPVFSYCQNIFIFVLNTTCYIQILSSFLKYMVISYFFIF
jgi:4-amino-4-deoxy-L-arabinose transferase-like glycosyltransferase